MTESSTSPGATDDSAPEKPRIWMFGVWFAVVAVGMIVLLAVLITALGGGLNARIAALEKEGQPISIADLKAEYDAVKEEENAAPSLDQLRDRIREAYMEVAPILDKRASYETPLQDDQVATLQKFFADNAGLFSEIQAAIDKPKYAPVLPDASISTYDAFVESTADNRTLARLLVVQAEILSLAGKHQEAAEIGLSVIRFGEHLESLPTMRNYLVSVAVRQMGGHSLNRSLRSGELSNHVLAPIRERLSAVDVAPGFINALETERAIAIDRTRNAQGSFALTQMLKPLLEDLQRWIDSVEKNGVDWNSRPVGAPASPGMVPAAAVHEAALRWQAQARALLVLEQLNAAKVMQVPDDEALKLPSVKQEDPFRAPEPLQIVREKEGWAVFSVGPDGASQNLNGDDIGYRAPASQDQ